MQIPHTKLRPLDMHRQENLRSPTQILDVAISPVLRAPRDRPRALFPNLVFQLPTRGPRVYVLCVRRLGDRAVEVRVCRDELAFALVPCLEDGGGGRAPEDAGVDEACEADAGDVARGAEDAFEVPNSFSSAIEAEC